MNATAKDLNPLVAFPDKKTHRAKQDHKRETSKVATHAVAVTAAAASTSHVAPSAAACAAAGAAAPKTKASGDVASSNFVAFPNSTSMSESSHLSAQSATAAEATSVGAGIAAPNPAAAVAAAATAVGTATATATPKATGAGTAGAAAAAAGAAAGAAALDSPATPKASAAATATSAAALAAPKAPAAPKTPDRAKVARNVAAVGIGGNVALSAFKLFAGIVGNSAAMISDAVHSLSDVFATAIAFAGVRMAERDADAGHPYGHERLECVASLTLGIILLLTGLAIGGTGLDSVATRQYLNASSPSMIALVAAIVSIASKEAMFWYTRHQARAINSSAFMADAWHHRSDALSSVGALVGIGAEMLGFRAGDELASIVIGIVIVKVAADVLKDAINNMTDTPCDRKEERAIEDCITAVAGVVRIDALRTRKFGSRVYVDVEIAADGDLSLREAHAIAESVHDAVEATFPEVKHVMVHENPA